MTAVSALSLPQFHDEAAAFAHLESVLWPDGPVCPHCGSISDKHYNLAKTRVGLRKCRDCRKQFTVRVKTVFESAHLPLHKMLQAVFLLCSSKKGISSHQLHRILGVQYKTAWFLTHRIRAAMQSGDLPPMGGAGGVVEADETYIGRLRGFPKARGPGHKNMVLTLVERGGGARSFHIDGATRSTVEAILNKNVSRESALMTDEAVHYKGPGKGFASHDTVNHGDKEYVRGHVTTNTVEGYYSIFKRGMKGVYQHCGERHLHRYLAEFDFRYSNRIALGIGDKDRAGKALAGISGKRLKYRSNVCA